MIDLKSIGFIALSAASVVACAQDNTPVGDPAHSAGAALAERLCGACHAVGARDRSPHSDAPAFRTLGDAYPIEHLAEALAEGIMVGHPDMPVFQLSTDEIDALLAYLESVQMPSKDGS